LWWFFFLLEQHIAESILPVQHVSGNMYRVDQVCSTLQGVITKSDDDGAFDIKGFIQSAK
jgi:hypothetical protein